MWLFLANMRRISGFWLWSHWKQKKNTAKVDTKIKEVVYFKKKNVFQLDNVNIEGNDQTEVDAADLSLFPTEFIMESSVISQVCAHQEEPVWITNIKKGVLSSLQSTVPTTELGVNITEVCLLFENSYADLHNFVPL